MIRLTLTLLFLRVFGTARAVWGLSALGAETFRAALACFFILLFSDVPQPAVKRYILAVSESAFLTFRGGVSGRGGMDRTGGLRLPVKLPGNLRLPGGEKIFVLHSRKVRSLQKRIMKQVLLNIFAIEAEEKDLEILSACSSVSGFIRELVSAAGCGRSVSAEQPLLLEGHGYTEVIRRVPVIYPVYLRLFTLYLSWLETAGPETAEEGWEFPRDLYPVRIDTQRRALAIGMERKKMKAFRLRLQSTKEVFCLECYLHGMTALLESAGEGSEKAARGLGRMERAALGNKESCRFFHVNKMTGCL